jgi:hypothetical protein
MTYKPVEFNQAVNKSIICFFLGGFSKSMKMTLIDSFNQEIGITTHVHFRLIKNAGVDELTDCLKKLKFNKTLERIEFKLSANLLPTDLNQSVFD